MCTIFRCFLIILLAGFILRWVDLSQADGFRDALAEVAGGEEEEDAKAQPDPAVTDARCHCDGGNGR